MKNDQRKNQDQRIAELEHQVRALQELAQQLLAERKHHAPPQPVDAPVQKRHEPAFRRRLDEVIGEDGGESFEARVGAVWLSRLGVVIFMTALAFGARLTFTSDDIGPLQKVLIAYGVSVVFLAYGFYFRKQQNLFAEAILGCGLAVGYFTTYAMFFIGEMKLVDAPYIAAPLLLLCLVIIVAVSHRERSQTVAGIALFLAYYTVVASAAADPTLENLLHALAVTGGLAVITLIFHYTHRWLLFTWAALISTYGAYLYFFWRQPGRLGLPEETHFWVANSFLAICYVLFSLACIIDARKRGEYRRMVAPLAGVNSLIFFTLTWFSIRDVYPELEWAFRSIFAGMLLFFAIFAETTGPRRNYLFQVFIAKAVIMLTLALQAFLSHQMLLVAMAIECLGLGFSYKRSGIIMFKLLGQGLLAIVFVGALAQIGAPGATRLGPYVVPSNWFAAAGVALVFFVVAWFYEKFIHRTPPEQRVVSGQWFLADSALDWRGTTMALVHAAAAAFILLTITIVERGEDPAMPFLLGAEAGIASLVGIALLTPQVHVASVLLLAAAHVSFHIFLWLPLPGFEQQPHFVLYTALLATFTYLGAHFWERYLRRYHYQGPEWEHHAFASLPYLAATAMLITLAWRELAPLEIPLAMGALGMILLLSGSLTGYAGVTASGVAAIGAGAAYYYHRLFNFGDPLSEEPLFLPYTLAFLLCFVGAERLLMLLQRFPRFDRITSGYIRTGLVGLALILAMLGLHRWAPQPYFVLYAQALAFCTFLLGLLFRESRYRWGALAVLIVAMVWAFAIADRLSLDLKVLTFGSGAVLMLLASWIYSRRPRKAPTPAADPAPESGQPDAQRRTTAP